MRTILPALPFFRHGNHYRCHLLPPRAFFQVLPGRDHASARITSLAIDSALRLVRPFYPFTVCFVLLSLVGRLGIWPEADLILNYAYWAGLDSRSTKRAGLNYRTVWANKARNWSPTHLSAPSQYADHPLPSFLTLLSGRLCDVTHVGQNVGSGLR